MLLERIQKANDIKSIPKEQLPQLAAEIREFLIQSISETGGHLASNLGTIELTIAMHYVYDFPEDKIVWDVGHQSYTHKILTGRKDAFARLRKYKGLSGFPKRGESDCDSFNTGHSSTSLSAGIGFVKAREVMGKDYHVASVIGDGSLTGGMAYEALNNASTLHSNFTMVLNDNKMSIAENIGGISTMLNNIRTAEPYLNLKTGIETRLNRTNVGEKLANHLRKTKNNIKGMLVSGKLFENMGITYLGPLDGHDIEQLIHVFEQAKKMDHSVIIHVLTEKGRGYIPAERQPRRFHGTDAFHIETGEPIKKKEKASYTDVFGASMKKLGSQNENVVAVTAAMPDGTGLYRFAAEYPSRFFDVGIAEQHAVTFSAAMAAEGLKPVVAIYSSFLQRAYDQIVHDVCMQRLPVVFAIDRAGIVGSDGETHQGVFDLSFLSMIPQMTVMAPKNKWELHDMLQFAVRHDGPIALRYPRGTAYEGLKEHRAPIVYGKSERLTDGTDVAIVAVGSMVPSALEVRETLEAQGVSVTVVNARFVKPLDEEMLLELGSTHKLLVTMEDNVETGGFGQQVRSLLLDHGLEIPTEIVAIPDQFVEQGSIAELWKELQMDSTSVAEKMMHSYEKLHK